MFNLREFLMSGFKDAIGKMADYQVILNATGYFEKNVLTEEDLAELQELINEKNTPKEIPEETSNVEEIQEENAEISDEVEETVETEEEEK